MTRMRLIGISKCIKSVVYVSLAYNITEQRKISDFCLSFDLHIVQIYFS